MPIIERLLYRNQAERATRVLILLPTRELAIQVYQVGEKLAQYTNIRMCLAAGKLRCFSRELEIRLELSALWAITGKGLLQLAVWKRV